MEEDPLIRFERITKDAHDTLGKMTRPVFKQYPLLFALLITFSAAAIIHGFELFVDQFEIFRTYPSLLVTIGVIALIITGTLYKTLRKLR